LSEPDLIAWRQSIEHELNQRIIPFWRSLRDNTCGGFLGLVEWDLTRRPQAYKATLLNSRIMWFFSSAARHFQDESLLDDAQHAYRFLVDRCLDRHHGGVVWSVEHSGPWLDTTKQTYNQAFAIYALAAYHQASGHQAALDLAFELFELLETRLAAPPGYGEAFDQAFHPIANDKLSENGVMAERTMNTLLHVFEAYAGLYVASGHRPEVGQALRGILGVFTTGIYNPAARRLEVFFDQAGRSLIDLQSFGHDIEASWLLSCGADLLGDPPLSRQLDTIGLDLVDSVYQRAYRDGSVAYEELNGQVDNSRVWWVQAEAMVAFYTAAAKVAKVDQARLYTEAAHRLWQFCVTVLADPRPDSEWFWATDPTGEPLSGRPIVSTWKCPYHSGRACLRMLDKLADALNPQAGLPKGQESDRAAC